MSAILGSEFTFVQINSIGKMKSTILRFGSYGVLTITALSFLIWYLIGVVDDKWGEVIGYSSMVVSLLFVYFGIKHFRDKENKGVVSFGKALLIGMLISLMAALAFGILDLIYVKFVNPDFMTDYYTGQLEQLQIDLPADEFEIRKSELESEKAFFMNPLLHFFVMSMTVFVIGFIISLISAMILQRKEN
ncbi:DUF4199 domain-containing protein [Aggregatimonas sangjinii]|uniref:DUF4199 domain-containing protein n=1 Tax=Aggregatimonas sangjinii TaxID=2583587 RepID=A0A5B7SXB8_9FLAO|nr:DUF4199 domain-containing protein [Aggregatimonas sangjinii]QCX01394.1 DUF4199 domain-containing protein [Aggregatimonas sangjinii]